MPDFEVSVIGTVIVLISSGRLCTPRLYSDLALWFVPEGTQSAWTLQEAHRNSTNCAREEAQSSERLPDQQTP